MDEQVALLISHPRVKTFGSAAVEPFLGNCSKCFPLKLDKDSSWNKF